MNRDPFVRHRGPITATAWIPGTQKILTSAYDSAVACFDVGARRVTLLGYHQHLVNRVAVDAQGRRAASVSSDYNIYLWDLETRQLQRVLQGHSDDVEDFCFVDDALGISVSRDRRILIWDLHSGRIVRIIRGHLKDVLSVAYHAGRIYTSSDDTTLRVWDLLSGQQVHVFGPFETESDTCAIDPIRGQVVLGCDDGCLRIFAIPDGRPIATIKAHDIGIKKVACSPADGAILTAGYDGEIHLWDGTTRRLSLQQRQTKWERAFSFSPDGAFVVAGTFDGTVLVWDAADGRCIDEIGTQAERPGNDCFNDVAAAEAGQVVLVSDAGSVRTGQFGDGEPRWLAKVTPRSGRMLMNAVTMDVRSRTVVAGAHNQRLHLFEWTADGLRNEIEVFLGQGPVNCVRVASHRGWEGVVFAACYTGAIVQVARSGQILGRFRLHENAVKALRLHPELPVGVSASADSGLASWNFDGTLLRTFPGHTAVIDDVDLDPSGTFLASTGRDFHLKVYRLQDGVLLHSIELAYRSPKALLFLDEKTVIVTNYWGELLRVSLTDRRILRRSIAHNGISAICRADPAGHQLVVCSYDGAAYLVRAHDLAPLGELRAMTQRVAPALYQ